MDINALLITMLKADEKDNGKLVMLEKESEGLQSRIKIS